MHCHSSNLLILNFLPMMWESVSSARYIVYNLFRTVLMKPQQPACKSWSQGLLADLKNNVSLHPESAVWGIGIVRHTCRQCLLILHYALNLMVGCLASIRCDNRTGKCRVHLQMNQPICCCRMTKKSKRCEESNQIESPLGAQGLESSGNQKPYQLRSQASKKKISN